MPGMLRFKPVSGRDSPAVVCCMRVPAACVLEECMQLHAGLHVRLQLDAKRLEGDVEYVETDEEEKGINFAQLVADRQIALSGFSPWHACPGCGSMPLLQWVVHMHAWVRMPCRVSQSVPKTCPAGPVHSTDGGVSAMQRR